MDKSLGMELHFIVVLAVLLVPWCLTILRLRAQERELKNLTAREREYGPLIQSLVARVYRLERTSNQAGAEAVQAKVETAEPQQVPITPVPPPTAAEPAPVVPDSPAAPKPQREDWEVVVGGSWLNKLGVLVLVVGIALFLGYSLTQLGPAGKIAIGLVVGASLLGSGIALRFRPGYAIFSQGLVAGGWAAIYFTVYAMHGVEEARIVNDPILATALLLAVSAGMILHSFTYRSENITALAYVIGFVTLNVTPVTDFSVVAVIVLAASLIVIALEFDWIRLGAAGVILTYATFVIRYDPVIYSASGLLNGQSILWAYWILFETFDILDLKRRGPRGALYILNAAGFLFASIVHGDAMHRTQWAYFYAIAAAAYLASASLRYRISGDRASGIQAIATGGYQGPVSIAALLAAIAIEDYFKGLSITVALLIEAETFVAAGLFLDISFLQTLGGLLCVLPFSQFVAVDTQSATKPILVGGREIQAPTPVALLMAVCFYLNRALAGRGWLYGSAATLLVGYVIHAEVEQSWATAVWAALGTVILLAGVLFDKQELRLQSYLIALVVFGRACVVNLNAGEGSTRVITCAIVIAAFYASQIILRSHPAGRDPQAGSVFSLLGSALLTLLLSIEVQGRLLTVAFGMESVALLVAGFLLRERVLRLSGLLLFLFCIAKLFAWDLRTLDTLSRIVSFIVLGLMLLAASWVYTRFRDQIHRLL
jgi:hypothetical protein